MKGLKLYIFVVILISAFCTSVFLNSDTNTLESRSNFQFNRSNKANNGITSIVITSDTDFDSQASNNGWIGDGSQQSPYVISDYVFVSNGPSGIMISNTNTYFEIRNVSVSGSTNTYSAGIELMNVSNGLIVNNSLNNNYFGIYIISKSKNIILDRNIVFNNSNFGISAHDSYNLNLTGNTITKSQWGLELNNVNNSMIKQNYSGNHTQYGIYLHTSNDNWIAENNLSYSENGIYEMSQCTNNTYQFNTISYNSGDGFYSYGDHLDIQNNYIKSNGINGINLWGNNDTITDNIFENSTQFGIKANTNSINNLIMKNSFIDNLVGARTYNNNTISSNLFLNNPNDGIQIDGAYNSVDNNTIFNSDYGIYLSTANNNNISNNNVNDSAQYGIFVYGSHNIIKMNSVFNSTYGLYLFSSTTNYNTFSNNIMRNNTNTGVLLSSSSHNNTFINNQVSENGYGFQIGSNGNTFIDNSVLTNSQYGINLSGENNTFYGNKIYDSSNSGVRISSGDFNNFTKNIIRNNDGYGFEVTSSSNNNNFTYNFLLANNNASVQALDDNGNNNWSIDEVGNYWDDYVGVDTDLNGIGDTPYDLDGTQNVQDLYPLVFGSIKPDILLTSPGNNSVHQSGSVITFDVSDSIGIDAIYYSWDGKTNTSFSNPFQIPLVTGDGMHQLRIFGSNFLGESTVKQYTFLTDDTKPQIDLTSPNNNTENSVGEMISFTITDTNGVDSVWFKWDDGLVEHLSTPYELTLISPAGQHVLTIFANDTVGNLIQQTYVFTSTSPPESSTEPISTTTTATGTTTRTETTTTTTTRTGTTTETTSVSSGDNKSTSPPSSPGFGFILFSIAILFVLYRRKKRI